VRCTRTARLMVEMRYPGSLRHLRATGNNRA